MIWSHRLAEEVVQGLSGEYDYQAGKSLRLISGILL